MQNADLQKCLSYLNTLCVEIPERAVGSQGNRDATMFFRKALMDFGWSTESLEFDAMDWIDGGASLTVNGTGFPVHVSPYSLGCAVESVLVAATTTTELEAVDCAGKILLLSGEIAREQLMPKNFVFYNPEEHQRIISLLERIRPDAIVCATGRNPALAGGVYPFPLIEDGDFDIPSVYMTEEEGERLRQSVGQTALLRSNSRRVEGKGYNVIGTRGSGTGDRIVVTAHIDAKKGTPGAIDNATGVIVLLLLAKRLREYSGEKLLEIVALNGEDYYAVPGQMEYIRANQDRFDDILLNINIDGAGYREGPSSFSFFDLTPQLREKALDTIRQHPAIVEGTPWPQGDHSIFVQYGRPAIAVSSRWFIENIEAQSITHTPADNPDIVDCTRLIEIVEALTAFIMQL